MNFRRCHHNRKGSVFLEAVMAIAMAAIMLSSMFTLQINVFKRLVTNSFRFSRFTTTGALFQLAALDRALGQEKFSYQKGLRSHALEEPIPSLLDEEHAQILCTQSLS